MDLCSQCYNHTRMQKKFERIQQQFKPKNKYNNYIFQLYVKYMTRYQLRSYHVEQTRNLVELLEQEAIEPIRSWRQVRCLAKRLTTSFPRKRSGIAFVRIGRMLQELNVLSPRELDLSVPLHNHLVIFDDSIKPIILQYITKLTAMNRSPNTVVKHLIAIRDFRSWWLRQQIASDIFLVTSQQALSFINEQNPYQSKISALESFYCFARLEKKILVNPFEKINVSRKITPKIAVLSPVTVEKILNYIKDAKTHPEEAMLLTLALFWGLRGEEFAFSLITDQIPLVIHLYQRPPTSGNTLSRPTETIVLPITPNWLLMVQKRFINWWQNEYEKTIKSFPIKPLCLPYTHYTNRPLSKQFARKRITRASENATGQKIPVKILRNTCALIHLHRNDGSALAQFGWSKKTAFKYTWCPRIFYVEE